MRKMRKLLLCSSMVLALAMAAGCGDPSETDSKDQETTEDATGTDDSVDENDKQENDSTTEDTDRDTTDNPAEDLGDGVKDLGDGVGDAVEDRDMRDQYLDNMDETSAMPWRTPLTEMIRITENLGMARKIPAEQPMIPAPGDHKG